MCTPQEEHWRQDKSYSQGPEVGMCLVRGEKSQEPRVARIERTKERGVRDAARKASTSWIVCEMGLRESKEGTVRKLLQDYRWELTMIWNRWPHNRAWPADSRLTIVAKLPYSADRSDMRCESDRVKDNAKALVQNNSNHGGFWRILIFTRQRVKETSANETENNWLLRKRQPED